MQNDNSFAALDAWVGLIAALLFSVFYYVAIMPPWKAIISSLTPSWNTSFMSLTFLAQLEWILNWAPLIMVIIALFWAVISPVRKQGQTWRDM